MPVTRSPIHLEDDPRGSDAAAGFHIQDDFERFPQKDDLFRSADGFTQKDFALRNASWHVSDIFCIRVCPYNKDYTQWWHRLGQRLAGTRLRGLMLALDIRLGYGERLKPKSWWDGEKESIWQRIRSTVRMT